MPSFRITPRLSLATALCCATLSTLAGQAYADRFTLVSGGALEGTLLNKQQTPRTVYQIETAQGVRVTLPAEQVREVVRQSAAEREYEQRAPTFRNTVEEQWKLAQWCQQQKLKTQREVHLRRILELDTDHVAARHALGYMQLRGVWSTTAEDRSALGYVLFRGDWRTPQDVALIEQREKQQKISKEWLAKLKRWRLAGEFAQIAAVRDAAAIPALCEMLRLERIYEAKSVYLDVLAAIGNHEAIQALIYVSLNDPDIEVFHNCAEIIERLEPPQAREAYLDALKNANNVRINR
ncbi:MAG TPA: hypothetical protein VL096_13055, partial [Pirellulaceae bacterium]|nr:hypothetical protein [Pirellulaceae bacterium]